MRAIRVAALVLALLVGCLPVVAQDFVDVQATINPVMQPKSIGDAIGECAQDAACSRLVETASGYFGAPPGSASAALAAVPQAGMTGEEGHYFIVLPAGYEYCRAHIRTISVVPASGNRASVMGVTSAQNGVSVYTWTPKRGLFAGRSWVEAVITMRGVKSTLADAARSQGACKNYGAVLASCRGATGVNQGMPACSTYTD